MRTSIVASLCALLLAPATTEAQAGTRTRVYLRADSSTQRPPKRVLAEQELLEIIAPETTRTGFMAVRTSRGEQGWVAAEHVWLADPETRDAVPVAPITGSTVLAGSSAPVAGSSAPVAGSSARAARTRDNAVDGIRNLDNPLTSISPNLEKPPLRSSTLNYRGNANPEHRSCGPSGAGKIASHRQIDSATFRLKNRTDIPTFSYAVTWAALAQLPYARSNVPKDRFAWDDTVRAEIERFEGVPLTLIGFIAGITDQKKAGVNANGESTNCQWTEPLHVDWHVSMTSRHTDPVDSAFIVEPTPRFLRRHANTWTISRLKDWTGTARQSGDSVSVTGFLFFDPDHHAHIVPNKKGRSYRISMWALHPVTKIEVRQNGRWVDLDDLPPL